jgi:hypothetical protein
MARVKSADRRVLGWAMVTAGESSLHGGNVFPATPWDGCRARRTVKQPMARRSSVSGGHLLITTRREDP